MSSLSPDQSSNEDPQDPIVGKDVRKDLRKELRGELIPDGFLPGLEDGGTQAEDPSGSAPFGGDAGIKAAALSDGERRAIARGRQVAFWLTGLEPKVAPFTLEGLVVAGMNAGHRQERSVDALDLLGRHRAPADLDTVVATHILRSDPQARSLPAEGDPAAEMRAPDELDRLVQERVSEPEGTMVRGMAKRLDIVTAPSELQSRLERQMTAASAREGAQHGPRSRSRSGGFLSGRAVAAAFALAAGIFLSGWMLDPASQPDRGDVPAEVAQADATAPSTAGRLPEVDGVTTTAGGLSFRMVRVTTDKLTAADRAIIGAFGLPIEGES